MNEELVKAADECYQEAELKAAHYFKQLLNGATEKIYVVNIIKDLELWKNTHLRTKSFLDILLFFRKNADLEDHYTYIQWLNKRGKLDSYLDRSVSYIFMRDLGKVLDSEETQKRIKRIVDELKEQLLSSNKENNKQKISLAKLYRTAQKEGIESTMIWTLEKFKNVSTNIPKEMNAANAERKLIKIIGGVLMHQIEEMSEDIASEERAIKLDEAIRLGYSYGLTYPFIDDILDANILSVNEKKQYSDLIRTTLITQEVAELTEWNGDNFDLIKYIHKELKEAFEYIKAHQNLEQEKEFFNQTYVFFNAQERDRLKDLHNDNYTNEEIYLPIILKSSYSRLIARSIINAPEDEGFDDRTFFYGIYNQLADDFTDIFDDMKDGAVTPYTYYMKYHNKRTDLINPFELYWTVIFNLIHNVYNSNIKTSEVILDRAINSLKRFKKKHGTNKYNEFMKIFSLENRELNNIIEKMVNRADDVDFFDKLIRDHMNTMLKNEREEQEKFRDIFDKAKEHIDNILSISKSEKDVLVNEPITDAVNYCLEGDGKRLRPIITWVVGVTGYGLCESAINPLLKALEYMHTASLIFDDLPSQDNAITRRGRPTLHQMYNVATAELSGIFLLYKAMEEQASLDQFDPKIVLKLIKYSSKMTQEMCKGQAMDLGAKGGKLTLEELNTMCFYKTGIAFEVSLVMPAMLGRAEEREIENYKKFAYHAGIAFQIKDDLLDVEGDPKLLGKSIGEDCKNNSSNFVTILGVEEARKEMWEHYCIAMDVLERVERNADFLKQLMNYIVNRDH